MRHLDPPVPMRARVPVQAWMPVRARVRLPVRMLMRMWIGPMP
ncbi:hypothetical protein [Streptomyces bicolor]